MNNFIPVEANVNGKMIIWHMDVSMLSLSELIKLKEELKGSKVESVVSLDAIIHDTINYNRQDLKAERREFQKNNGLYRKQKALIKTRRKGRR